MPSGDGDLELASDDTQTTRASPLSRAEVSSNGKIKFCKTKCPTTLVPHCNSYPCFVFDPRGGTMTPAFRNATSSFEVCCLSFSMAGLMEDRSARSNMAGTILPVAEVAAAI